MPSETPPPTQPTRAREGALHVLRDMTALGTWITARLGSAAGDPELGRNLPIAVLADLALAGTRRPAEIQQQTALTSGGVTKLLDRLEAQGLVTRAFGQVPGDRRAILVGLTPDGQAVADRLAGALLESADEVRAALRGALDVLDATVPAR